MQSLPATTNGNTQNASARFIEQHERNSIIATPSASDSLNPRSIILNALSNAGNSLG